MNFGIYPFDEADLVLLQYNSLFGEEKRFHFIDTNGILLDENTIKKRYSYIEDLEGVDWKKYWKASELDALIVTQHIDDLEISKALLIIEDYCKKGVSVYALGVREDIANAIKTICQKHAVNYLTNYDLARTVCPVDIWDYKGDSQIQDIKTPVIAVMGVLPKVQVYHLLLYLAEYFRKNGYRTSIIGNGYYNELMGAYSLNCITNRKSNHEINKICLINSVIRKIENMEKPDVILIGIDDPIIPFSKHHHFNFGIIASEILSAVTPDVNIVSLMNGTYNDNFYKEISLLCKYKFNTEVNAFYVSRYVPTSPSIYRDKLSYSYTNHEKNSSKEFDIFSSEDLTKRSLYSFVIDRLEQYYRCEQF